MIIMRALSYIYIYKTVDWAEGRYFRENKKVKGEVSRNEKLYIYHFGQAVHDNSYAMH